MKKFVLILLCVTLSFIFTSCDNKVSDDVIVLFTNDVHCAIDENIGYSGLTSYKKSMQEKYRHVVLVDCGDFAQGSYVGAVTKGEGIIDIMNAVGYDFAIFGNHEFDYGMGQLKKLVESSNAEFLNCNLKYIGSNEDWLSDCTKPYEIRTYGRIKVGFIGISTPLSILESTPTCFMEDSRFAYDFSATNKEEFYSTVQSSINSCLDNNVDFVVALSHLGMHVESEPYTSFDLIKNTTGIDVVLDAHSHINASCMIYQNKDGEDVLLSSTGTNLMNIGKLILSKDGTASVGYIDYYDKKDEEIANVIREVNKDFEEKMNAIVGHMDTDLSIYDVEGIRMVRNRELPIGDLVADAYRIMGNADIGMVNGGGIRSDLLKGDITYKDIIEVNPFGNSLCVVKVTGAELLDMLEYFYRNTQKEYKIDGVAIGEDGSFEQVSGLKFTIDTSIESSVEVDENDTLTGVGNLRRIKDVMVLKDGEYIPIDLNETYTIASHNYMIKEGGCGMLHYLENHELTLDESIADYQVLIDYIGMLNGNLKEYETVQDRIIIK